jgi:hypothetical protein
MPYVSGDFNTSLRATRVAFALFSVGLLSVHSVSAQAPPSPWAVRDVGSPAIAGSTTYSSGTYTVRAGGTDIWNTSDQFHFVYQKITGDVDIAVRVQSISQAHAWSKTGVMIRESLTGGSRHGFALLSAGRGYGFQARIDPGGFSSSISGVTGVAPGWVRLVRAGSRVEAFRSTNGTTWTSMGVEVIPMVQTVYVGIATTSHNSSVATRAVLTNLKVVTSMVANRFPTVSLTAPGNGATYTAPASVALAASAADSDGTVAKVEFYSGGTLLGSDTTAPYSFTWGSVPGGAYSLTAVAYDNLGARTTSTAASISVSTAATTAAPTAVAFHASADHATVTSYRFDVFASGANPATATPVATANLGKPAPDANGDITSNQATLFSGLAAGNYQATVTAIASGGSSRSAAVTFTR